MNACFLESKLYHPSVTIHSSIDVHPCNMDDKCVSSCKDKSKAHADP
jgi:hypothetical protein